jgi:hypothetical protein
LAPPAPPIMKTYLVLLSFAAALLAGCASDVASAPRIKYPVTYKVPFGNTQVRSDAGPQVMNTQANQQVAVEVGQPLYYQVIAPAEVAVQIYEVSTPGSRRQISQMQGTTFTGMVTPQTPTIEFSFGAARANSGGTLEFSLSDQPLTPP